MGTKADFYVGRGLDAEWVGSLAWDSCPSDIPLILRQATTEEQYREYLQKLLSSRVDGVCPEQGWPWSWDTSRKTNYAYAFDQGQVWACTFGSSWWEAVAPEPEHTSLKRYAAQLPDMTFAIKREAPTVRKRTRTRNSKG